MVVVDVVHRGPATSPRFQFKVATVEQADTLVRGRYKAFAGSGIVLWRCSAPRRQPSTRRCTPTSSGRSAVPARLFVDGRLYYWELQQRLWSKSLCSAAAQPPFSQSITQYILARSPLEYSHRLSLLSRFPTFGPFALYPLPYNVLAAIG